MKKAKWIILSITLLLAGFALFEIYNLSEQIRKSEEEKVRLWANAISQKAQLMNYSEEFFAHVSLDEHRKMEMYTNILRSFDRMDGGSDADFSLDYVRYIVDSCETAIIITNKDSIITVPSEMAGQKLEGPLLEEFGHNEPFRYRIWGMPMTLYYKESRVYTELRAVLDGFNESLLNEITNNSVFVPVLIVDSLQGGGDGGLAGLREGGCGDGLRERVVHLHFLEAVHRTHLRSASQGQHEEAVGLDGLAWRVVGVVLPLLGLVRLIALQSVDEVLRHVEALFLGLNEEVERVNLGPRVAVGASGPVGQGVVRLLVGAQVGDGGLDVAPRVGLAVFVLLHEIAEIQLREGLRGSLLEAAVRIGGQEVETAE